MTIVELLIALVSACLGVGMLRLFKGNAHDRTGQVFVKIDQISADSKKHEDNITKNNVDAAKKADGIAAESNKPVDDAAVTDFFNNRSNK